MSADNPGGKPRVLGMKCLFDVNLAEPTTNPNVIVLEYNERRMRDTVVSTGC